MPNSNSSAPAPQGRLATLLALLDRDQSNVAMLTDTIECALAQNRPDIARELFERLAALSAPGPREDNLRGLIALQSGEFEDAAAIYTALLEANPQDSAVRYNLAWARAQLGDWEAPLSLLDESSANALPQAATLRVQALHQRGDLEQALSEATAYVIQHPRYAPLFAAASVVAVDAEDLPLATSYAQSAGAHPDALTTLATVALAEGRTDDANALFGQVLEAAPDAPRALIGVGLGKMLAGSYAPAAADIERGAAIFGDHLGSWVAAGWAYLFAGDLGEARRCFDTSLALDHNFAETHGSLAVLHLIEGRAEESRRAAQTAMRLNPQCFSGTLAQAMLQSSKGRTDQARAILDRALHTPLDASGRTIAQSLARHGLSL